MGKCKDVQIPTSILENLIFHMSPPLLLPLPHMEVLTPSMCLNISMKALEHSCRLCTTLLYFKGLYAIKTWVIWWKRWKVLWVMCKWCLSLDIFEGTYLWAIHIMKLPMYLRWCGMNNCDARKFNIESCGMPLILPCLWFALTFRPTKWVLSIK